MIPYNGILVAARGPRIRIPPLVVDRLNFFELLAQTITVQCMVRAGTDPG